MDLFHQHQQHLGNTNFMSNFGGISSNASVSRTSISQAHFVAHNSPALSQTGKLILPSTSNSPSVDLQHSSNAHLLIKQENINNLLSISSLQQSGIQQQSASSSASSSTTTTPSLCQQNLVTGDTGGSSTNNYSNRNINLSFCGTTLSSQNR